MFSTWVTVFYRRFRHGVAATLINIFGLALGMFVFLITFIYVDHELGYDDFHEKGSRVYRLLNDDPTNLYQGVSRFATMPAPLYDVFKTEISGVEEVTRLSKEGYLVIETDNNTFYEDTHFAADPGIVNMLTFEPIAGDLSRALQRSRTAIISERTAMKFFGTTDAVGKVIKLTGNTELGEYTVDAVFRDLPSNSSVNFNVILRFVDVLQTRQPSDLTSWRNRNYNFLVMLYPDADPKNLEQQLDDHLHKKYAGTPDEESAKATVYIAQPFPEVYLGPAANFDLGPKNDPNRLYMLATIALLVLVVATINYVNLTTARAVSRAKEVAVRKVSGAQQSSLVIQFLGESMLLVFVAGTFAVVAVWVAFPLFRDFIGKPLDPSFFSSPGYLIVGAIAFIAIVGCISGIYPALVLSKFQPATVLKGSFARSSEGIMLRNVLSVFQFSISVALIIAVAIISQQLWFMENSDPGYQREHIVYVSLQDEGVRAKRAFFAEELKRNPNIISASVATYMPNHVRTKQDRRWISAEGEVEVSFYSIHADENYLDVFDIQLVEGRNFLPTDRNAFLINETAAKTYGWSNPVGMHFRGERGLHEPGDTVQIIGVIKDLHFDSYRSPIQPLRIGIRSNYEAVVAIKVKPDDFDATASHIERTYKSLATTKIPYRLRYFDEEFSSSYKSDRQLSTLINVFSIVSVLIACLGLYGLSTHSIVQRMKEISVRKILGAHVGQIVYLMMSKFIGLIVIAFLFGAPLAWYVMDKWLTDFAYHVDMSVLPFIVAIGLLLLLAIGTVGFQTLKAARANVSETLRME